MKRKRKIVSILLSTVFLFASFPSAPTFAYSMSGITDEYNNNIPQHSLSASEYEEVESPGYVMEQQMEGVYKDITLVGKYKFNYCGAGSVSGWTWNNGWNWKEICYVNGSNKTEYNFSKVFSEYENSSGSVLENKDNSRIYKAYLVINTIDYHKNVDKFNDIVILGPAGQKMTVGTECLIYKDTSADDLQVGGNRFTGYTDITDFVKDNGYGTYYVADIPFDNWSGEKGDTFCSWNIVVIEENDDIDIRALKLRMGFSMTRGEYDYESKGERPILTLGLSLADSGLQSKVSGDVKGQLLCNWAGSDFDFMYSYLSTSSNPQDLSSRKFLGMTGTARTSRGFTCGLFSINGTPIKTITAQKDTYALPLYWDTSYYIKQFGEDVGAIHRKTVMNGSQTDTELVDIGGINSVSTFTIPNKTTLLYYIERHPFDMSAGAIPFIGLNFDIDAPTYYTTLSYDKEEYYRTDEITLTAEFKNDSISSTLGLYDGDAVINVEKDMNIESVTATFTDEKGISTILPESMIDINEENVVTVGFGPDEEKISQNKDSLKVVIKGHIAKGDGEKTYESTTNVRGKLITSTGLKSQYVENASNGAAYHTMEPDYVFTVDFNGGEYLNTEGIKCTDNISYEFRHKDTLYVSAVSDTEYSDDLISGPSLEDNRFLCWEVIDGDGEVEKEVYPNTDIMAYVIHSSDFTPGNITIRAKWIEAMPPELTVAISPDTWTNTKPVIAAMAKDEGTGVKNISVYSPDGKAVAIGKNTVSYTVTTEGEQTYTIKSSDFAGNIAEKTVTSYYDITKPVLTVSADYEDWTNKDVTITVSASDTYSGIKEETLVIKNGAGHIVASGTDTLSYTDTTSGEETFTVEVYDNAGNCASTTICTKIDTMMPTISISANSPASDKSVTVNVSASDGEGSGLTSIKLYRIPAGTSGYEVMSCTGNKSTLNYVSKDTETTEYAVRVTDKAGNEAYVDGFYLYKQVIRQYLYDMDTSSYVIDSEESQVYGQGTVCNPEDYKKEMEGYEFERVDSAYTVSSENIKGVYYRPLTYRVYFVNEYFGTKFIDVEYSKSFSIPNDSDKTFDITLDYCNADIENKTLQSTSKYSGYKDASGNIYASGTTFKALSTTEDVYFYAVYKAAETVSLPSIPDTKEKVSVGWYRKQQTAGGNETKVTSVTPKDDMVVYAYWNNVPIINTGVSSDYYRALFNKQTIGKKELMFNISSSDEEDADTTHTIKEVLFRKKDGTIVSFDYSSVLSGIRIEDSMEYRVIYYAEDSGTVVGTSDTKVAGTIAETNWYPVFDSTPPVIVTVDKYIYITDSSVNEDNIINILANAQKIVNKDRENNISYWINEYDVDVVKVDNVIYDNVMYTTNIADKLIEIKNMGMTTDITIVYSVTNMFDETCTASAELHYINKDDDDIISENNVRTNYRFIEKNTLSTLNSDSVWSTDSELNAILIDSLNKNSDSTVIYEGKCKTEDGLIINFKRYY